MGVFAARRGRDDIADFHLVVGHDYPINEQFDQLPLVLERRLFQPAPHALAKVFYVLQHLPHLLLPIDLHLHLPPLLPQAVDARIEVSSAPPIFLQTHDLFQIRLGQPLDLVLQARLRLPQIG